MTREELKEHCKKTVEQCEMWAIHRGEEPSGKVYEEHKAVLDILEQQPCEDAISRENAIRKLRADTLFVCTGDKMQAISDIEGLPPVTQKSGKWIEQIDHEENCRTLICSNCDRPALHDGDSIWVHKFCPHCGAKMVKPQESKE